MNLIESIEMSVYDPIITTFEGNNLDIVVLCRLIIQLMQLLKYDNSDFVKNIVKNSLILINELLVKRD